MKIKSLLLATTVLAVLSQQTFAREGTYIGAQVGAAKAKGGKPSARSGNTWKTTGNSYSTSNKWDWTGGAFVTHEWIDGSTVLGVTLGFDMSRAKSKQKVTIAALDRESTVHRQYSVNLLAKAGYANFHNKLLPYVTAGAVLSRYRFDINTGAGGADTNLSKTTFGYAGGAGLDYMINNTTDVGLQYLYTWQPSTKKQLTLNSTTYTVHAPKGYHAATVNVRVKI